jgi:hypothetical protein
MPNPDKQLKPLLDSVQKAMDSIDANNAPAAKAELKKALDEYRAICFSVRMVSAQEDDDGSS